MSSDTPPTSTTTILVDPTINTSAVSSPLPSRPPPNTTLLQRLHKLLLHRLNTLAQTADQTLVRLSKLLSTPSGTDALLCTTSYLLDLLSTLITHSLPLHPTPTTPLIHAHPKPTTPLAHLASSTKTLSTTIADHRIITRLWGLITIYTWARSTAQLPALNARTSTPQRLLRSITWLQILAGVFFQVLENTAYLSSKGVLGVAARNREARWWVWSCRFWAVHVGLEMLRLGVLGRGGAAGGGEEGKGGELEVEVEGKGRRDRAWWADVVGNVAYAPMTLHLSVEEGFLSELGVAVLGTIAGGAVLVEAWRGTK